MADTPLSTRSSLYETGVRQGLNVNPLKIRKACLKRNRCASRSG